MTADRDELVDAVLERLRASQDAAPSREERMALARQRSRRRWITFAASVGAVAIVIAGLAIWQNAQSRMDVAAPTPTATLTPIPTPTEPPVGRAPEIVLVEGDLLASGDPAAMPVGPASGTVIAATGLGTRAGWSASGVVMDSNLVCLNLHNDAEGGGSGNCVSYAAFIAQGITVDRGAWSITWYEDGRVDWIGI